MAHKPILSGEESEWVHEALRAGMDEPEIRMMLILSRLTQTNVRVVQSINMDMKIGVRQKQNGFLPEMYKILKVEDEKSALPNPDRRNDR